MSHVSTINTQFNKVYYYIAIGAFSPVLYPFLIDNPEAQMILNNACDGSEPDTESFKFFRNSLITAALWPFWLPLVLVTIVIAFAAASVVSVGHLFSLIGAAFGDLSSPNQIVNDSGLTIAVSNSSVTQESETTTLNL